MEKQIDFENKKPSFQTVDKRSLSSLLRLPAVLITVKGNSAPHQSSRLERQALAISLKIKFLGFRIQTET
ncbi:hypothetical protein AN960_22705 [Bacillus sp. FJAT-25509]|uniref:hypothetical protein n=1 Tax=Bacillaceae TaxID=186817 RepID=UPI0006F5A03C|nr:hypothetical protein [Bacillus sp. FJAT-25509]KQL32786.1 hypothetical protein AN960_22705 [Bacillus sp. FJAT-25509]